MSEALSHMVGDYLLQSDWMAIEKTKRHTPAAAHALTYTAAFLPITRKWKPLAVIGVTHFIIDRWRLARHVVWLKNQATPDEWRHPWDDHVKGTGYHTDQFDPMNDPDMCLVQGKPIWMAVWLMIIGDNTMHLLINHWALKRWVR